MYCTYILKHKLETLKVSTKMTTVTSKLINIGLPFSFEFSKYSTKPCTTLLSTEVTEKQNMWKTNSLLLFMCRNFPQFRTEIIHCFLLRLWS